MILITLVPIINWASYTKSKTKLKKAINVYKSGKVIAKKQNDMKTIGELTEALMILDADEDDW